jgi:zinc D-Ala-D-Ala carboxypeptidase
VSTVALAAASTGTVSAGSAVEVPRAKSPVRRLPASVRSLGVLVNKSRPLKPATYVPKLATIKGTSFRLRPEAAAAYRKMAAAAGKDGIRFRVVSAYRSYARQKQLFAQYTRMYGKAYASRIAALPGKSEHQTGLALDLGAASGRGQLAGSFASTRESKWLAKNAYKYGFILRYPKGKEKTTGYAYEPWHYRYVGKTIAKNMKAQKLKTLEAYYFGP